MLVQPIRAVFDTFAEMQTELDAEKRSMTRNWTKRQAQTERISSA